jgi:hypothetical protein
MNGTRSRTGTALLLSVALTGCSSQPLPPDSATMAEAVSVQQRAGDHPAAIARPLTGRCETTFNPPSFPPPLVHRQTDVGTCRLSHLGRAEFHSVKEINFATGTQTTTEATFTAANGDLLRAVGSGVSAPGQPGRIGFSATLTFIGGTGRFENASGEARVEGEAVLATRTATLRIVEGWIAYRAAR